MGGGSNALSRSHSCDSVIAGGIKALSNSPKRPRAQSVDSFFKIFSSSASSDDGKWVKKSRHIEHYVAKHGTEATFIVGVVSYLINAIDTTALSTGIALGGALALMYSEVIINALEAKRLWEFEDHNVTANNIKIAINAFNALQISFFAYNPLLAFAAAPASFTLGVVCEMLLTKIEMDHAKSQANFSNWFDDQVIALDYFDTKIKAAMKASNEPEINRLSHKRNAIYFAVEARRRVYLCLKNNQTTVSAEPTESTALIETKKCTLDRKLQEFSGKYAMSTAGFTEWLDEKVIELNNADTYLDKLIKNNQSIAPELIERRNHLLLDIERRCDSYKRATQEIPLSKEITTSIGSINHPFEIHYNQVENKITSALEAKEINFNKDVITGINDNKDNLNASDNARDKLIQTKADAFYQLQRERLRIKFLTCVGMTTLVLAAAGISVACPVLAVAMGLIAIAGCYYLMKAGQKAYHDLDKEQTLVPPVLRNQEPLKSVFGFVSVFTNCSAIHLTLLDNSLANNS